MMKFTKTVYKYNISCDFVKKSIVNIEKKSKTIVRTLTQVSRLSKLRYKK